MAWLGIALRNPHTYCVYCAPPGGEEGGLLGGEISGGGGQKERERDRERQKERERERERGMAKERNERLQSHTVLMADNKAFCIMR